MGEIRASDNQGIPSRRQLYAQHRALSRALMDPDLQNLRRKGHTNLARLKELSKWISDGVVNGAIDNTTSLETFKSDLSVASRSNHVSIRLCEVITIFDEVDRAARRLEQLTEQRRERLRELTRQRALEDEINEVSLRKKKKDSNAFTFFLKWKWNFLLYYLFEKSIFTINKMPDDHKLKKKKMHEITIDLIFNRIRGIQNAYKHIHTLSPIDMIYSLLACFYLFTCPYTHISNNFRLQFKKTIY